MKKTTLFTLTVIYLLTGCETKNSQQSEKDVMADTLKTPTAANTIGEPVEEDKAISLEKMVSSMDNQSTLEDVTVEGKVTEVCQAKGCWMKLDKGNGETVRVTFKDYALFMPKDIAGKEVVIHGKVYQDTVSIDDLKHYAEDAGKSEAEINAISEPEIALAFEADGVIIEEEM